MDESHESQKDIVPGKTVKRRIANLPQKILRRRSAGRAIEKTPIGKTPDEMSVERARRILEYIVNIPERGLDAHERHLSPAEQLQRFGGIHYEDIKKAFGVYADYLVTTHGAKKPQEYRQYRLLKEDFLGPDYPQGVSEVREPRYYDLELSILLDLDMPKVPKTVRLRLHDGKRHGMFFPHDRGMIMVESGIPLVDVKPDSSDEKARGFYDDFSLSRPIHPGFNARLPEDSTLLGLRIFAKDTYNPEKFHREYKGLYRGMRWTAANLLRWDENRIIYPDDLDKPQLVLARGQAQLTKSKEELPPPK